VSAAEKIAPKPTPAPSVFDDLVKMKQAGIGPLDPVGAAARHQLCCPYCAEALTWRGEPAGALIAHAQRYECPNCRGRWRIALEEVRP